MMNPRFKTLQLVLAVASAFGSIVAAHAKDKGADAPKDAAKDAEKEAEKKIDKATAKAEPLRKITIKAVCGKVDLEELLKAPGKKKTLCRIWGVARRLKPGESDYGSYVRFLGSFMAVNLETGALYKAGVVLLPKYLEEQLAGVMGAGENVKEAEFAIELGVRYDADAAAKYIYFEENLVEPASSDAMTRLNAVALLPALEDKSKS